MCFFGGDGCSYVYNRYIQNFIGPCVMVANLCTSLLFFHNFKPSLSSLPRPPLYIDFLPAYYQACKNASPTRSGVELFGLAIPIGPALMIGNATIAITKTYRVQLWFSWALTVAAMGALSTLEADSSLAKAIGFPVLLGVGSGLWYGATYFPVLAPLPVSQIAPALAFFAFGRQFAGVRTPPPLYCFFFLTFFFLCVVGLCV